MKFTVFDAIKYLQPSARFGILDDDYDKIDWHSEDKPKPTREEVEAVLLKFNSDYQNTEYRRKRADEYPAIGDQLDALFHAGVFPAEMAAQIQAIKDKYPKN